MTLKIKIQYLSLCLMGRKMVVSIGLFIFWPSFALTLPCVPIETLGYGSLPRLFITIILCNWGSLC